MVPLENDKQKVCPSFKGAYCNDQDDNLVLKKRRALDNTEKDIRQDRIKVENP